MIIGIILTLKIVQINGETLGCTTRVGNLYHEIRLNVFEGKGGFLSLFYDKRKSFLDRGTRVWNMIILKARITLGFKGC